DLPQRVVVVGRLPARLADAFHDAAGERPLPVEQPVLHRRGPAVDDEHPTHDPIPPCRPSSAPAWSPGAAGRVTAGGRPVGATAGRVIARSRRSRPSGWVPAAAGGAGPARSGRPDPGAAPGTGARARPAAGGGRSGWPGPPSAR